MSCISATLTRKQTGITIDCPQKPTAAIISYKQMPTGITAAVSRVCTVFLGYTLCVSDGRLYAADANLYVDKY